MVMDIIGTTQWVAVCILGGRIMFNSVEQGKPSKRICGRNTDLVLTMI